MARALSVDLRDRVVAAIAGGLSRRQAAVRFGVSAASAVRWRQLANQHGTPAPQQQGGDRRSMRIADEIGDLDETLAATRSRDAKPALADARAFFVRQTAAIGQHRCDLSWVWREQRAWSPSNCNRLLAAGYAGGYSAGLPRDAYGDGKAATVLSSASTVRQLCGTWTGPTYVIADKRSYSSAEMFAAVMQDNRIGKLVGDRTGGDGCGFMTEGDPIVLRHSHLRFRVPNCMRLRADGTNEEAGIAPDLPVLPTEGESDRARGERALRTIAADTGVASRKPG